MIRVPYLRKQNYFYFGNIYVIDANISRLTINF